MRAIHSLRRLGTAVLVVAALLTLVPPARAGAVAPLYYPQTGHTVGPNFTLAWRERGGVAILGYPLSEEFSEGGRTTQYFERAVLQTFPEYVGRPPFVQGLQLGRELTIGREAEAPFHALPVPAADHAFFPETGHSLGGAFRDYWTASGGLPVLGYPLSEEFVETNPADGRPYPTQYFERGRLEYHADAAGTPGAVTLGLLGAQRAATRGLLGSAPFVVTPAPPALAQTISRFATSEPIIVLTLDAGADRGNTVQILDTLAAKNIRVSFGITGLWARENPDLVRRIGAEGHHIINHTFDHRSFTGLSDGRGGLSADARIDELEAADAIFAPLLGTSARPWFRPPYGDYDAALAGQLAAAGYRYNLLWTIDTQGWNGATTGVILDRTFAGAAPGAIVLMHVGAGSRDAEALGLMIDGLRARGYRFATAAEMVAP